MDVARDEQDLLVVTDAGFGKRTGIDQFRKTKRGAMGVRAIKAAQHKGDLAGALVVREHEELLFISEGGMVQRTSVRGISRQGRDATGVRVMNVREDDRVSAVALVVESDEESTTPSRTRRSTAGGARRRRRADGRPRQRRRRDRRRRPRRARRRGRRAGQRLEE